MKIQFPRFILFLYLTLEVVFVQAQWTTTLPSSIRIDEIKENHLLYFGNAEGTYKQLFDSLNRLILKGDCGIHIVQIGDSHIQAGFFPEQMRKNFSTVLSSGCGSRGLIFPYRIAKTNNPIDYSVKFSGNWEHCRNVEVNKNCGLGLMGIMAQTNDSVAVISFHFKESSTFREFNFIRIFHDPLDTSYSIVFPGLSGMFHLLSPVNARYSDFRFDSIIKDSLRIRIIKKDTTRNYFTLYGVDFENGDPGISYSASGVNGAEVTSYLRCDKLKDQLNLLKPNWVIISLGTNDAYPLHFNKDEFIGNYISLIKEIREAAPGVPVLLTVPGDSYRRHRYDNLNMEEARKAIISVATTTDCAVWDFYSLMGGPKSILKWYKAGLVAKDKLHFDGLGYTIQADLLFGAFMEAYISFIDKSNSTE